MADLTEAGLLFAPHTSAGRLPTDRGLRLFVDGLLQFGELSEEERNTINRPSRNPAASLQDTLAEASTMLSGLSAAAGLVLAPKSEGPLQAYRIRAARLRPRAGRSWSPPTARWRTGSSKSPPGLPPSALQQASNYLNARLSGLSLGELRRHGRRRHGRRPHRSWTR